MIRKVPDDTASTLDVEAQQAPDTDAEAGSGRLPEEEGEPEPEASESSDATEADRGLKQAPDRPLPQRLEAVLFAAGSSLSAQRLARVLEADLEEVKAALDELLADWNERPGAVDLVEISGGWRFMTRPAYADDVAGLAKKAKIERLSPAALETLAIVAYRQPLGRADIEAVRGVQSGPLLRVLLDRDLIRIAGRSPEPGHPLLYGTTKRFLDHFGLSSLKALPDIKDLLDVS